MYASPAYLRYLFEVSGFSSGQEVASLLSQLLSAIGFWAQNRTRAPTAATACILANRHVPVDLVAWLVA